MPQSGLLRKVERLALRHGDLDKSEGRLQPSLLLIDEALGRKEKSRFAWLPRTSTRYLPSTYHLPVHLRVSLQPLAWFARIQQVLHEGTHTLLRQGDGSVPPDRILCRCIQGPQRKGAEASLLQRGGLLIPALPLGAHAQVCPSQSFRIGQEHKRYVVVSNDLWNRSTQTAMVVRTTTSPARHAPGFPWIQGGKAKACAGEVVTVPVHELQLRPSERPYPSSLPGKDMVAIAREIVATHELAGTLHKQGIICP